MNGPPDVEAKAPPLKSYSDSEDWRQHLYNQERMINNQDQLLNTINKLFENQKGMADLANKLDHHLSILADVMHESTRATKGMVAGIIKVPIVIVIMGMSSAAFYLKYIEEHTWLLITAVACFPYLGESITAVAKLFGIGKGNSGEDKK